MSIPEASEGGSDLKDKEYGPAPAGLSEVETEP